MVYVRLKPDTTGDLVVSGFSRPRSPRQLDLLIRYSFDAVRTIRLRQRDRRRRQRHLVQRVLADTPNSGPAWMTHVSPSSLKANTLPLYAHGDAVNVAVSVLIR